MLAVTLLAVTLGVMTRLGLGLFFQFFEPGFHLPSTLTPEARDRQHPGICAWILAQPLIMLSLMMAFPAQAPVQFLQTGVDSRWPRSVGNGSAHT